jgi:hypothetical protein
MASNLLYRQFFPPHGKDADGVRISGVHEFINARATGWGSKLAFHFVTNRGRLARCPGRLNVHQIIKRAAGTASIVTAVTGRAVFLRIIPVMLKQLLFAILDQPECTPKKTQSFLCDKTT